MERAYLKSDATYDGLFFIGVRTTGIFCRPTCPARKPLPENVEYFAEAQAAVAAGFRPCKRCRPLLAASQPVWVAELLAEVEREPSAHISDRELKARGIDPATVRRYFHKRYGMSFQAFTRGRRLSGGLQRLQMAESLDAAVFESGYESHSGFRDAFVRVFGDTPGSYRNGDCVTLSWLDSPVGQLLAGATAMGICLLEFTERDRLEAQLTSIRKHFRMPAVPGVNGHLEKLQDELKKYFAGKLRRFTVPLQYPGTDFQRRVWRELLEIPYGETRSYEDVAIAVGVPKGMRAVGRANGLNRIAIVIPCHRVVNKGGHLGGYGGGLRRKQFLLDLERRTCRDRR
ncbi:MAG: bifunctional transcriptional activator/DNA repair protein Ada [Planctomycetes bacterium]|nr:bifunctional transcriptional activator/DNA repair protein Ada [Planctomycetota bacterium]